jgi:leucine dehydrogenase
VKAASDEFGATAVQGDEIYAAKADIFAPCALGAIINDDTIPKLKVEIVCGGANNQLLEPEKHGAALEKRGISYAPDFVANAGGVINVYGEVAGWTRERALRKADEIYDTILGVYKIAKDDGLPPTTRRTSSPSVASPPCRHGAHLAAVAGDRKS